MILIVANLSASEWAAWWGAVVATIALGWNIFRDFHQRGRLRLEATYDPAPVGYAEGRRFLAVRITNIGTEPIVAQGLGAKRAKGTYDKFNCERMPKRLERGDFVAETFGIMTRLSPDTTRLFVWDSTGKKWYLPKKKLHQLLRQ